MSEWIEYTGSDEQIEEMKGGFLYRTTSDSQSDIALNESHFDSIDHLKTWMRGATHYLAAKPHPYADLIKIWADTGCPVYAKHRATGQTVELYGPRVDWNYEEWEFSLAPFED